MALDKLAYEKLIEEMKGRDTTNGWDVVVSYDEDKINNLLKAKQGQGSVQLPEMNVPFENPNTGDTENVIYRLKLSNPSFKIEESSGRAVLTYNLTGDYGAKRRPIPGGIEMHVTVGVARLEGTVTQDGGTSGFKPQAKALHPDSNTAKTQEPSQVVDMSGSACHGICIVFRDAQVDVVSQDPSNKRIANTLRTGIRDSTEDHLHKSEFHYFLGGVNAQASGSVEENSSLQPEKFCFSLVRGDEKRRQPGALVMWIAVQGGSSGRLTSSGRTSVTFHPDQSDRNPIPKGNSASVIFRHDLIARKLLQPTLEKKFDQVKIVSYKGTEGMKLTGRMKNAHIQVEKTDISIPSHSSTYIKSIDGVDFDAADPETWITIDPSLSSDEKRLRLEYTSPVQKGKKWTEGYIAHTKCPVVPSNGSTDLTFKWAASGKWESSPKADRPNMLTVTFTKDNQWGVETVGKEPPPWYHFSPNVLEKSRVPDEYKHLKVKLDIDLEMGILDYFLTTNLLFPGKHIFIADAPAADLTKSHGLAVPRDVILTGQVTDHL